MKTIVLTNDHIAGSTLQKILKNLEPSLHDLQLFDHERLKNMPHEVKNVECIFSTWGMPVLTSLELRNLFPDLTHLLYAGGDTSYFDAPFISAKVSVVSCKHLNAIPVAEFVVANTLLANKGVLRSQAAYRRPLWWMSFNRARAISDTRQGNYFAKVGLLGCGNVGQKLLDLLSHYDLEVLVNDIRSDVLKRSYRNVSICNAQELFKLCDVVINLLPSTKETLQLVGAKYLESMKYNATFINVGRGDTVNERELIKVLKRRSDLTAVLDVSQREPILPWSSLLRLPNVFLTPHVAGSSSREVERMARYLIKAYQKVI